MKKNNLKSMQSDIAMAISAASSVLVSALLCALVVTHYIKWAVPLLLLLGVFLIFVIVPAVTFWSEMDYINDDEIKNRTEDDDF